MHLTRARRLAAGVAVVAAVLAMAPAPASAAHAPVPPPLPGHQPDEDDPQDPADRPPIPAVSMYVTDVTVPVGAKAGTPLMPVWSAAAAARLDDPKVVYQLSEGLKGVTLEKGEGGDCTSESPTRLVCSSGLPMHVDQMGMYSDFLADVRAGVGAVAGTSGTVRVTFTARGITPIVESARIRVAESVDLEAGPSQRVTAAPGGSLEAPLVIRNAGATTITGASVQFDHDFAIEPGPRYRNCLYEQDVLRSCTFAEPLEPGRAYTAAMSLKVRPDTQAPGEAYGYHWWLTPAELADFHGFLENADISPGIPGSGGVLALTALSSARGTAQADPDIEDNWSDLEVAVTGRNGADLAAVGAEPAAAPGAETTMSVGVRSVGKATVDMSRVGEPAVVTAITVPRGTTVLRAPEACLPVVRGQADGNAPGGPGAARYECYSDPLFPAGAELLYEFDVRLPKKAGRTTGAVAVNEPCECVRFADDIDPSNNKARIVVTAGVPGGVATPDDDEPDAPGTGSGATGSAGSGGGASLPITGPQGAAIAGAGAALVVLGGAVLLLTRRRRDTHTGG